MLKFGVNIDSFSDIDTRKDLQIMWKYDLLRGNTVPFPKSCTIFFCLTSGSVVDESNRKFPLRY